MIQDPLTVFLVLVAVVFVAIRLEEKVKVARMLGSVLLAIMLAAILANTGVLPQSSTTYDMLGGLGANLGIALILLGVNLRTVLSAGPKMLAAFGLGAVGTVMGAILGSLMLHNQLGDETWKLAGQYTGTYIGGGVNMVAVGRGLETSSDVFSAAIAADNVTTAVWMVVCFGLPGIIGNWYAGSTGSANVGITDREEAHSFTNSVTAVPIKDVAALVFLAVGAVWFSSVISDWVPYVPQVLWLTTIVLILAQLGPVRSLSGGPMWGNYILQVFLASIGAQSIISEIVRVGPAILYFTLIVVGVHGLLTFGVGRLAKLDLPTLVVASQANIGGPASAMALATARGYGDKLLPGIAIGILGYAVGNYAGFGVARVVHAWLAGG